MKKIEKNLEINEQHEKVWCTLMKNKEYTNWNTFVKTITGLAIVGEKIATTIHLEGKKPTSFKPIVLVNETNKEFRCKGKTFVNVLFHGVLYFVLQTIDTETTRFSHCVHFCYLSTH